MYAKRFRNVGFGPVHSPDAEQRQVIKSILTCVLLVGISSPTAGNSNPERTASKEDAVASDAEVIPGQANGDREARGAGLKHASGALREAPIPLAVAPAGCVIIEGDIIVPAAFAPGEGGVAAAYAVNLWASGIVPYVFDASALGHETQARNAMNLWEAATPVRFVPRSPSAPEAHYVRVRSSDRNSSWVGMCATPWDMALCNAGQDLSIVTWDQPYRIAHELGHAIGLWHEQSRGDRDNYVRINLGNISPDEAYNFAIRPNPRGDYGFYDFDSVMHYGECYFSRCAGCPNSTDPSCSDGGRTITVLSSYRVRWQDSIGQRERFSDGDKAVIQFLYGEGGAMPTNGSFEDYQDIGLPTERPVGWYKEKVIGYNPAGFAKTFCMNPAPGAGISYAYLGDNAEHGPGNEGRVFTESPIILPPFTNRIVVAFYLYVQSEARDLQPEDFLWVRVRRSGGGNEIVTERTFSNTGASPWGSCPPTGTYQRQNVMVSIPPEDMGQPIMLEFSVKTDGQRRTIFRIDDVVVAVQAPGIPVASIWGLLVSALLTLTGGAVMFRRRLPART